MHAAAISPDGKYLAYADSAGIHMRLIETGETSSLASPPGFGVESAVPGTETLAWFPACGRRTVHRLRCATRACPPTRPEALDQRVAHRMKPRPSLQWGQAVGRTPRRFSVPLGKRLVGHHAVFPEEGAGSLRFMSHEKPTTSPSSGEAGGSKSPRTVPRSCMAPFCQRKA